MPLFTVTMFVVALWQVYRRKPSFSFTRSGIVINRGLAAISGVTLVASYALQLMLTAYQAAHDGARNALFNQLPLGLVYINFDFGGTEHDLISLGISGLVLVETAALTALCLQAARESRLNWPYYMVASSMLALSLAATTLTSSDAFYYAYYGTLGFNGYSPPTQFTPEYALINLYTPLLGTIYGPLWIAINHVVGSFGHTVVERIMALRIFNAVLLLAALGILRGLKASKPTQIAFALNPMLLFYFVVNAHNDFMAIVPCMASIFAVHRSRLAAAILIAAAGSIKIPFLLIGCLTFSKVKQLPQRALLIFSTVALCLTASWVFGGEPYLHHLTSYVNQRSTNNGPFLSATVTLGAFAVFCIYLAAIAFNRFYSSAALLVGSASPFLFPWYLSWGIPYALAGGANVTALLLALPLSAVFMDSAYRLNVFQFAFFTLVVSACIIDVLRNDKRGRVHDLSTGNVA